MVIYQQTFFVSLSTTSGVALLFSAITTDGEHHTVIGETRREVNYQKYWVISINIFFVSLSTTSSVPLPFSAITTGGEHRSYWRDQTKGKLSCVYQKYRVTFIGVVLISHITHAREKRYLQ